MPMLRRNFLKMVAASTVAGMMSPIPGWAKATSDIKAIAFDAFPIFDPRPVFGLVKQIFPQQGNQFGQLWRTRLFEYTWLLTSAGKYQDFSRCIELALDFTARDLKLTLSAEHRQQLLQAFYTLNAYPDVAAALKAYKDAGLKLAFLSNMTDKMLHAGIENAGLGAMFDYVLSTDQVKTFKPDPNAYRLGVQKLGLQPEQIAFAAFSSWDAIGAKWFGYPTVWINRLNFTPETLGPQPDRTGVDMSVLNEFVFATRS